MTKIIDNRTLTMANALSQEISSVNDVAIASAYFNVRGFSLIKDALKDKKLRFLLGKEPQSNVAYRDEILSELENEVVENEDDLKFFNEVKDAVEYFSKDYTQVRIVKDGFFHGKVYMGASPSLQNIRQGFGITGSSNFTYSGLTSNMELNMLATDREAVEELSKWFDGMWNSSLDFKKEFIEFLSNYVTAHSPLEIVAKALHESLKDRLNIADKVTTVGDLYPHQKISVSQAWEILNKYDGVIIADPVGLGKTRVGISLAYIALRYGMKPLIIAPKSVLKTTWKNEMNSVLGLEIPSINTEKVSADPEILNKNYSDKNFIIIDEAHYFRSSSSQRFSGLSSYLVKKDRKLVLITATPINNSLMDLYNLLSLFVKDDEVPDISSSLKGYFAEQQKKLYNNEKVDLDNILKKFVVRTSRPTAEKLSGNISFPSRIIDTNGVNYKLPLNPELISNKIDEMSFIYYDMAVDKQVKDLTLPDGSPIGEIQQRERKEKLKELVKVVIKINYFKRLESSLYSFKKSLEKQKEYIEKTIQIAKDKKIFVPPKFKSKMYGDESTGFDLSEIPNVYLQQLTMTYDEINMYVENAKKDIEIIDSILKEIENTMDHKFDIFLNKLKSIKINVGNGIIIFTSYADTASYIYEKLSNEPGINDRLMLITGNEGKSKISSDRFEIIRYFMNQGGYLVSTDVLSAGQNLQNAQYIFNYDLPWNPVVLIQRTGRIDRLRSPYKEIYIINMTPDNSNKEDPTSLEHFIKIMEKLRGKIDGIRQTIGSDVSILGEIPLPKDFNVILEILKGKSEGLDKIDESSKRLGIMLWETDPLDIYEQIKEQLGEEKIKSIPFGSGAYKKYERNGIFVLYRSGEKGDYEYHWVLRFDDGEIITDEAKILSIIMQVPNDNKGEKIDYSVLIEKFKKLKEDYINYLEKKYTKKLGPVPKDIRVLINLMYKNNNLIPYIPYINKNLGNTNLIKELKKICHPECNPIKLEEKLKELIPDPKIDEGEKYELPKNMHRVVWAILKNN
ncbi:MAG: SNF2-related protein [Thermoplasmata archaeon]